MKQVQDFSVTKVKRLLEFNLNIVKVLGATKKNVHFFWDLKNFRNFLSVSILVDPIKLSKIPEKSAKKSWRPQSRPSKRKWRQDRPFLKTFETFYYSKNDKFLNATFTSCLNKIFSSATFRYLWGYHLVFWYLFVVNRK